MDIHNLSLDIFCGNKNFQLGQNRNFDFSRWISVRCPALFEGLSGFPHYRDLTKILRNLRVRFEDVRKYTVNLQRKNSEINDLMV